MHVGVRMLWVVLQLFVPTRPARLTVWLVETQRLDTVAVVRYIDKRQSVGHDFDR